LATNSALTWNGTNLAVAGTAVSTIGGFSSTDAPPSLNLRLNRGATQFNGIAFAGAVTYDRGIYLRPSSDTINIGRSAGSVFTDQLSVDGAGNVGVGVTPTSTWNGAFKVTEISAAGNAFFAASSGWTLMSSNAFYGASNWQYGATGNLATAYEQFNGTHVFKIAPNNAGAAGATCNFTNAMTLDASGNLGIGTTSPTQRLEIRTAADKITQFLSGAGTAVQWQTINDAKTANVPLVISALQTSFFTGGSERLVIDSSGNLGLGVTPSAWSATFKAMQVGARASLSYFSGNDGLYLANNSYYNGTNQIYIATGTAAEYQQTAGQHIWKTAASGTAGNTITFTQAMTLDASGNLLVGKTSSSTTVGDGFGFSPDGQGHAASTYTTNAATVWSVYSTGAAAYRFYVGYGGSIFATSITITAISDQRLKENVRDIDTGLSSIMALKPRRFDWKEGKGQDKKNVAGFIAQEFEDVFPECVGTSKAGEDGIEYKNINHETLIPTLVKAIQELKAEIDSLKSQLNGA
jgi:hypothetical protein